MANKISKNEIGTEKFMAMNEEIRKTVIEEIKAGIYPKSILAFGNSKTACPTLNFPAIITCSKYAFCEGSCGHRDENGNVICYACKAKQATFNAIRARLRNLLYLQMESEKFWNQLKKEFEKFAKDCKKNNVFPVIRLFDSGDIPTNDFMEKVVALAKKYSIQLFGYTKQFKRMNDYIRENGDNYTIACTNNGLTMLYSRFVGYEELKAILNPYNAPEYAIIENGNEYDITYVCEGFCGNCSHHCKDLKEGEITYTLKHGNIKGLIAHNQNVIAKLEKRGLKVSDLVKSKNHVKGFWSAKGKKVSKNA